MNKKKFIGSRLGIDRPIILLDGTEAGSTINEEENRQIAYFDKIDHP